MQLAKKISLLGIEGAFAVLVKARALEAQGKHIIHLEIGEPDFPTAQPICDAGIRAIQDGRHFIWNRSQIDTLIAITVLLKRRVFFWKGWCN